MPKYFQTHEIQDAITKLESNNDHAGKALLQRIQESIDSGVQIDKASDGGKEVQNILNGASYDLMKLHSWVEGQLQVLKAQINISGTGEITKTELTSIALTPTQYAEIKVIEDLLILLHAGIKVPKNSGAGIEIQKMMHNQDYDITKITDWINNQSTNIERTQASLREVKDFREIVTGNLTLLEPQTNNLESHELRFFRVLETLALYINNPTLGVNSEIVRVYEAYIGAKRLGQIDTNGKPISPDVSHALSSEKLTNTQKFFNGMGDNFARHFIEDQAESWTSYESPSEGSNDHMIISNSEMTFVRADEGKDDYSVEIQTVDSVFLLLIEFTDKMRNGELTPEDVNRFDTALANFPRDIQSIHQLKATNIFIKPEYVTGLTASGFLDSTEDGIGRDFNEEGNFAKELYEGFHGTSGRKMSLEQLARRARQAYDFDYTIIDEASINSMLEEIKTDSAGWFETGVEEVDEERIRRILTELSKYDTRQVIQPLQEELEYLENWKEGDPYDPYIRIGMGVNSSGGIISHESYGPYTDPREKALMIGMHLSTLHSLEKDPSWNDYAVFRALIIGLHVIDAIGIDGFVWDNENLVVGSILSAISWNIVLTRAYRRGSHMRFNVSLNPMNWLRLMRQGDTAEVAANEAEPAWYEKLSEAERKSYLELVNSHSEVNELNSRDQRKLRDIISLLTISDDLGDSGINTQFSELGRTLLDNRSVSLVGSPAYANERFWNVKIFQILNSGGIRGNGMYEFFFDNNSLRSPRIGGSDTGRFSTGVAGSGFGQRLGYSIASGLDRIPSSPYAGNILSHRNTQAHARSPLFTNVDTMTLSSWKAMIFERYKKINETFEKLINFEKYRPDYVDDSELDKMKKEAEEMRKQFLRGKTVELDAASGDIVRDAAGKPIFIDSTEVQTSNRISDFEKFVKNWMKKVNPDFDLEYGKALQADAISDAERTAGRLIDDMAEARNYANSLENIGEKETMLRRIGILEDKLKSTSGEVPEGGVRSPYSEHMTKVEFYQRLGMIMDKNSDFDKPLDIKTKSDFDSARIIINDALAGKTPSHILSNIFSKAAVEEETRRVEERKFDPRNLDDVETQEGRVMLKAELYGIAQGNEDILNELGNIRRHTRSVKTMDGFMNALHNKVGILKDVDFDRNLTVFKSDAMRNIVEVGGTKYYIEGLISGEASDIQKRISEIKAQQEAEYRAKNRTIPVDGESTIMRSVISALNGGDGGSRSISTKQIFLDTIRRVL